MEAAGVGYTAINVAMGNTRVVPYSYCVDAHAGLDADIVTWSFVSVFFSYSVCVPFFLYLVSAIFAMYMCARACAISLPEREPCNCFHK